MSADPVAILRELVAFRTDLEGRERPLAEHLAGRLRSLGADDVIIADVPRANGNPASWVYARYGDPRTLVNAHLDTVPANAGWSTDPFTPLEKDGRLYALDAVSGKKVWEYEAGAGLSASPAVAAGKLVIGSQDGKLFAFGE